MIRLIRIPVIAGMPLVARRVGKKPLLVLLGIPAVGEVPAAHGGVGVRGATRVAAAAVRVRRARPASDALAVGLFGQVPIGFVRTALGHAYLRVGAQIFRLAQWAGHGG